ncbi:MAG TPA: hypothetical protein VGS11_07585 [Candidatus Bathyarchaeia archaeon]|nr:hypothetical protein [Candidatus Bathyarchaeia archaeon]
MNRKIGKIIAATAIVAIALVSLGQPVHAQSIAARYDRASYVPGDSGTLSVTIVNDNPTATLEVRNLTIYWPWAQLVDGKWPSGANATDNLSPWPTIGSKNSGNNVLVKTYSFTIPSWYGGSILGTGSNCPDSAGPRYDPSYHGCVMVGITANPHPNYVVTSLSIQMSLPTYTPVSITSQWLPLATLVILVVATAFLGLTYSRLGSLSKKS